MQNIDLEVFKVVYKTHKLFKSFLIVVIVRVFKRFKLIIF